MEHAKKMILIEPRVLESLRAGVTAPVLDPTAHSIRETDQTMRDILEGDQNAYDKGIQYQQALWRYLNRIDQYKDRPLAKVQLTTKTQPPKDQARVEEIPKEQDRVEQDVIASVPKTLKSKAERLIQRLKSDPDVKWNERGELEFQGRLIKNSNLTDLVNDVLRKRKNAGDPIGWQTFAKVLQNVNAPQDLVINPVRWRYVRDNPLFTPVAGPSSLQKTKSSQVTLE